MSNHLVAGRDANFSLGGGRGRWDSAPLRCGPGVRPLNTRPSPTSVTTANLVVPYVKRLVRNYRSSPAFQCQWNQHWSIDIVWIEFHSMALTIGLGLFLHALHADAR